MKNVALVFICLLAPLFTMAQEQEPQKVREVGIAFSNLDNFGFTYKTGTERSLWRFTALSLGGSNYRNVSTNPGSNQKNFGFGLTAGKEHRRTITDDLYFRYGLDIAFWYRSSNQEQNNTTSTTRSLSPEMDVVLGLNYNINEKIVLGAELLPYFRYSRGNYKTVTTNRETKSHSNSISWGVSSQSVLLTLAYRF
jgi:hypothetical protein